MRLCSLRAAEEQDLTPTPAAPHSHGVSHLREAQTLGDPRPSQSAEEGYARAKSPPARIKARGAA